jgi:hypothetical protein
MACSCTKRKSAKYVWTGLNAEGEAVTIVYDTEIQAKAKVLRKGGTYTPQEA